MTKKINLSFQGFRGLFALGVMFSHCYFLGNYLSSEWIFNNLLSKLANANFFFVLSGFLIASSQITCSFFEYIKKKIIRIYPLYFLILIIRLAFLLISGEFEFSFAYAIKILLNACLLQGWGGLSSVTSIYTVTWFLSSLLFCYIVGYFLVKLKNANPYRASILIFTLAVLLLLFKLIFALRFPTDNTGYYYCYLIPLAGLADFLFGMIASDLISNIRLSSSISLLLQVLAIVLVILSFASKNFLPRNYCRAFVMLPVNVLLVSAFSNETDFSKTVFGNSLCSFLGNISFEFYLIHTLVISLFTKLPFINYISSSISPFVTLLIFILITMICSYVYTVIFKFFNKNVLKIQRSKHSGGKNEY